ncbi:Altered inheritance of mitochondria protein, mitochondrial [Lachnellula willkommii]|uniref:Altered inheritance of mitochondria protein, mitochondrial n=1 Tax=Lachnellula willkommii TaxID=215461 RepID=A0A559MEI0_9HELO|nr:Altered inheritance of mitochondria protein, mitochondrial [Lachnellula willkommii]
MDATSDLFHYTSGRWIYNESLRLKEQVLNFDVTELKKAAAAAVHKDSTKVHSFSKLAEGGFNRAFEMTIDGIPVIARLPYPSTYPKHFTVASEVATINLVRSYGVPAPKILGYSATSNNAVGSEYVIMEKVAGRDLGDIWYELSEKERLKVLSQVGKLESVLFSISLPAYGSIYHKRDLEVDTKSVDIPGVDSEAAQLCIGPDVAQKWWYDGRGQLPVSRGPFTEPGEAFTAGAVKEIAWLKSHARPRLPHTVAHRDLYNYQKVSPADHIASVEKYLQIAPHLVPRDDFLSRQTLRHPDLNPHNLFVSDDFTITGVIDWQHSSVLPLVLQAGIPGSFQNFGDEVSRSLKKPFLPESFDSMSAAEQAAALEQYRKRQLHYYYFVATAKHNKSHYDALKPESTMPKQKLQQYASAPWEGDNITLKAELIRAVQNWSVLTANKGNSPPACPIDFSDEEVEKCLSLEAEQYHIDVQMEKVCDRIGVSADGWTSNERYEDALGENESVKAEAVATLDAASKKEFLENWPLDDHEEN